MPQPEYRQSDLPAQTLRRYQRPTANRTRPPEAPAAQRDLDWAALLTAALSIPSSTGNTYRRLYNYSTSNLAFFMMQGIEPQPVGTYQAMLSVGRQVRRGSRAKAVLRPITVKSKHEVDENGDPRMYRRFTTVNAIFALADTDGPPLPEVELPEWSLSRALGALAITQTDYESFDGNSQGHSFGRNIAINPLAVYPMKTTMHELAHCVAGHTTEVSHAEYLQHRGVFEVVAEGSAHLVMNELGMMTPDMAEVSRGYLQAWNGSSAISDQAVRTIFKTTDTILQAGYEAVVPTEAA